MKKYLTLLFLVPYLIFSQEPVNQSLYNEGKRIFDDFLKGNLDALVNRIDPELDDDSKSNIAQTILLTKQQLATEVQGKNATLLNVLKENLDEKTGEFAVYLPVLLSDGKIVTIKIYGAIEKGGKVLIVNEAHLLDTEKEKSVADGYKLFLAKCFACHGKYGEGTMGVNLTDDYWKHAHSNEDVFHLIKEGKKGTIMMAFKNFLSDDDIKKIVLYLSIMQGQRLKKGKGPEGKKVKLLRNLY